MVDYPGYGAVSLNPANFADVYLVAGAAELIALLVAPVRFHL